MCSGLAVASPAAFADRSACGMPDITQARELHQFMSLRAVDVIRRATHSNEGLAALISPSASFSLGAGDVGRPLGSGVSGVRTLAQTMKADTYRFLGWNYMDGPADPCSKQEVEVEFSNTQDKTVYRLKFTFIAGRVVSADGWERSYETGRL